MRNDTEVYYYDRERLRRRRKFKRIIFFRRLLVLLILLMLLAGALAGLFFAGRAVYKKITDKNRIRPSDYIDIPQTAKIVSVDNVYTEEELRKFNFAAAGTGNDSLAPDDSNDYGIDPESSENDDKNTDNADSREGTRNGLIIIDAGHGGKDSGAYNDFSMEKDINLSIAYFLKDELEYRGYSVFMTRTDDTFVGLSQRANLANEQNNPLAMVSIHQNSVDDYEQANGVEAWTYKRSGCVELADCLANKVSEATGAKNRGVNYRENLVVTSKTTMPSVIIECGYMSNNTESENLINEDYQVKLARGIANALDQFIDLYY